MQLPIDEAKRLTLLSLENDRSDDGVRTSKFAQSTAVNTGTSGDQETAEEDREEDAEAQADGVDGELQNAMPNLPGEQDGEADTNTVGGGEAALGG